MDLSPFWRAPSQARLDDEAARRPLCPREQAARPRRRDSRVRFPLPAHGFQVIHFMLALLSRFDRVISCVQFYACAVVEQILIKYSSIKWTKPTLIL